MAAAAARRGKRFRVDGGGAARGGAAFVPETPALGEVRRGGVNGMADPVELGCRGGSATQRPPHLLIRTISMVRPYRRRAVSIVHRADSHDPLERIEDIGGVNSDRTRWSLSQAAAIAAGTDGLFVKKDGTVIRLIVLTQGGRKQLRTDRAQTNPEDLLTLLAG